MIVGDGQRSSPLVSDRDGKHARGVRARLLLRMWSEKAGGGGHDVCRRDRNAGHSRTSGSGPGSLKVPAHGRGEVRRVASRCQPFLCRTRRSEESLGIPTESVRRARLERIAEQHHLRSIRQRNVRA